MGKHFLAARIFPVSYPKKLPCPAWGISASRCRMGAVLGQVEGSVCHPSVCYAKRGRFTFGNVTGKMEEAWEGLRNELWVPSGVFMINWTAENYWRWFHSGDLQSVGMLQNIITIARNTRHVVQWLPTREREIVLACREELAAAPNLRVRASATMVGGPPPTWWDRTSTVIDAEEPGPGICPAPEQDHACGECRNCWGEQKNVAYRKT